MNFKATAYNENGDTFSFRFQNFNWNGIEEAAKSKLDNIVANDNIHQKYGPWNYRNIDVSA